MDIFVDSAELEDIRKARSYGICAGVTTNPSLIKKAAENLKKSGKNVDMEEYIKLICKTVGKGKSVSLEVVSLNAEDMIKEGIKLYDKFNSVAGNVAIKVPVSTSTKDDDDHYEGLKAIRSLADKGIPVNATLIFTPEQALLAAKAGAEFVSPFAGRIDDYIRKNAKMKFDKTDYFPSEGIEEKGEVLNDNGIVSGVDLVLQAVEILELYGLETKVIGASLRNARQVREVAETGAQIATVPFAVLENMIKHPKTFEGIIQFSKDVVPEYKKLFD